MRFSTQRTSRLQPAQRTFTAKQQSKVSWMKILASILVIWLCGISYWMLVVGLGNSDDSDTPSSSSDSSSNNNSNNNKNNNNNNNNNGLGSIAGNALIEKELEAQIVEKLYHKEHRNLWKPQSQLLPKLDFHQPEYIVEIIKSEYNRADWQPKDSKNEKFNINYDIIPIDYLNRIGYKKPEPPKQQNNNNDDNNNNNNENEKDKHNDGFINPSGNYKCLHYCNNNDVYNYDCVLKHLQYWRKSQESPKTLNDIQKELESLPLSDGLNNNIKNYPNNAKGFLTFKNDCGGFNNLRQAFEYFVVSAWLYKRTLVFPVTEGWYLIDWGPIKRAVPKDTSGVSNYHDFYDINDLGKIVSIMNMTEFLEINQDSMNLETQYRVDKSDSGKINNKICEKWNWDTRQNFKKYLNQKSEDEGFDVPFGPNHNVLMWPNESYVLNNNINNAKFIYDDSNDGNHDKLRKDKYKSQYYGSVKITDYIGHRKTREYNNKLAMSPYIHYPSCHNDDHSNHRYLCQIATSVAFGDYDTELKFKRLIRDHVHLVPQAFEIASYVIAYLGLFEYSAAHIRRNDFQFKNSWIDPTKSFENIDDYMISNKKSKNIFLQNINDKELKKGEILYMATDAEPSFFDSAKESFEHMYYRYDDFFNSTHGRLYNDFINKFGENGKKAIENVPRKLVGLIEMIICAGGRRFFGTTSSTYSAYITRLRGYIDAPDKNVFFHNHKGPQPWRYRATEYMREFPDMWEDIKDFC